MSFQSIDKNKFNELTKESKPVLVCFSASWCIPCKVLSPILEQLSEERSDIVVVKVDVEQEKELASKYRVRSIPALYLLKDGELVSSSVAVKPSLEKINGWVDREL